MLRIAVGQAEGSDPAAVIERVIARCRAQLAGARPAVGILYKSGVMALEPALEALRASFPGVRWLGGSTGGDVSSGLGFSEDSLALTLLAGDRVRIAAGVGLEVSRDPDEAVAAALRMARAELGGDESLILAWFGGIRGLGVRVVDALNRRRAPGAAIFGGALTPSDGEILQIFGDRQVRDALTLVLLRGPIAHAFAVNNAWRPVGPRQRVRSRGAAVSHIGDRTALDFHRHYLGEHLEPAFEFPLAVYEGEGDRFYLRVPNDYALESGEILYSADVPDGAEVQLTEYIRPDVVASTEASVEAALGELQAQGDVALAGALVFSCSVRKRVLGTRIAVEGDLLRGRLGPCPFAGFYAFGEVAPLRPGGPAFYHNSTMVTLVLGERGGEASRAAAPVAAPPAEPPPALDAAALARKLERSERYRARLEESRELQTAMLRTIGAEIEAARQQIARQNAELLALNAALAREQAKSEALLLNILPREVADELRERGRVEPVFVPSASVLFTDFVGFTRIAAAMRPADLLRELDFYFSGFDAIIERHGLEKLKTIGDAYMCAGGIPAPSDTHAVDAVAAAWAMQAWMEEVARDREARGEAPWRLRVGVHSGPLMAGVIGHKKFAYDIWGDTVNLASRLESTGEPGRINISAATHELVRTRFRCERRGRITAKNAGEIDMYFVVGPITGP